MLSEFSQDGIIYIVRRNGCVVQRLDFIHQTNEKVILPDYCGMIKTCCALTSDSLLLQNTSGSFFKLNFDNGQCSSNIIQLDFLNNSDLIGGPTNAANKSVKLPMKLEESPGKLMTHNSNFALISFGFPVVTQVCSFSIVNSPITLPSFSKWPF